MNLIDKQVVHKSFGKGNVIEHDDSYIEVHFTSGNKRFVFPDVFGSYLKLTDETIADSVEVLLQETMEERKVEEAILEKEREQEHEERKRRLELKKIMNNNKIHSSSQAVFWCDEEKLDTIFSEWKVSTGLIKSGKNEGKPRKLPRLHQNSACLLTVRNEDISEENRTIVGAYMVNEAFIGKLNEDGYIPAHSRYKIRLSKEESEKMLFWNYYINEKYPDNMTWNTGKHRYFENLMMAQILRDILSLRKGKEEEGLLQEFFEHFCKMNRINPQELPKANGALIKD